jgi:hypothetical protein
VGFLKDLGSLIFGLIVKKEIEISIPIGNPAPAVESPKSQVSDGIDWTDPKCMVSKYFTVRECLWLPSWQVMHIPSESEKANILKQAAKMDLIREFLGVPITVHCWIRPILNNPASVHDKEDYNALVKGARNSEHKVGLATDYDAHGLNCDDVRTKLEPKLEEWGIRMERMPGGKWIHNDCAPVVVYRYFNP